VESERTSLYLSRELKAGLRQAAKRLRMTQTQIVQEAIARYLAEVERPKFESLGVGSDTEVSGATSEQWLRENWSRRLKDAAGRRRG
jgi:Ribbon-helix-helix protein, copG family